MDMVKNGKPGADFGSNQAIGVVCVYFIGRNGKVYGLVTNLQCIATMKGSCISPRLVRQVYIDKKRTQV